MNNDWQDFVFPHLHLSLNQSDSRMRRDNLYNNRRSCRLCKISFLFRRIQSVSSSISCCKPDLILGVRLNISSLSLLMDEFSWTKKQAQNRIDESDENRKGYHRNFFNIEPEDPSNYHLTLNTGSLSVEEASNAIANLCQSLVSDEKEKAGTKKVQELYEAQQVVNSLVFEHKVNVNFLRAVIEDDKLILQGVADSIAISEKAASIAREIMPNRTVESCISIVQDFSTYP